ncbi:hypothetical protein LRS71_24215 [Rhodococcus pyridinivorans]|uniref:hypothetical protein n=1 Tax=Rhodococcus pyridinivorans TaxID=103816 RepID=UPI001E2B0C33|nr:hypothetical protein [Rhodococcus pyridinivorans]MCD5422620.1 hypothetical protein [Rhodococcus pyridinivorans]
MAHETRAFALVAPTVHVFSRVGAGGAVTVEAGGALYGKAYPVADPIGGIDRSEGRGGSAVPERSRRPSWGESGSLRRPRRAGGVVVPLLGGPQDQKFSLSKQFGAEKPLISTGDRYKFTVSEDLVIVTVDGVPVLTL